MIKIDKYTFNKANSIFMIFSWKLKKAYEKTFNSLGKEFDLTKNEIDVLLFLRNNYPLDTAKDIARYRAMSKSMISRSVDSLYKRGYIGYEIDEEDKRCIHLKITSTARSIVEKLSQAQRSFFSKLTENISKEEQKTMERVLRQMYDNILVKKED